MARLAAVLLAVALWARAWAAPAALRGLAAQGANASFPAKNLTSGASVGVEAALSMSCCGLCPHHAWCSPHSGNCYRSQDRAYYTPCIAGGQAQDCCDGCDGYPGAEYCSPASSSCYANPDKPYYKRCHPKLAQPAQDCCNGCDGYPGAEYCSPASSSCYANPDKPYYKRCYPGR
uniref:Uncharacterized protein n=1 Tax=Zooxanthella nutricula TaxID=1333877 RepID=A0A7S2Q6I4_9DINO